MNIGDIVVVVNNSPAYDLCVGRIIGRNIDTTNGEWEVQLRLGTTRHICGVGEMMLANFDEAELRKIASGE